jgi:hypothetical protein
VQRAGRGRRRRLRTLASSLLRTLDLEPAAVADGNSKRGIADAFVITEPAVEKHVTRICSATSSGCTLDQRAPRVLAVLPSLPGVR